MDELLDIVLADDAPPLVVITGPAGVGRTRALARLQSRLRERGQRVLPMRFTRDAGVVPARLALRTGDPDADDASGQPEVVPHPMHQTPPWSPIGPVEGAADDPARARWAAAAAAAPLLVTGNVVLLIDDAQWIDRDSLAVLEAMVRRLAGSSVRCVCAARTPYASGSMVEGRDALVRLSGEGLARTARLRPFDITRTAQLIRTVTGGKAAPELVARSIEITRGVPAALHDALAAMTASGEIRVVDRHAYLVAVPVEPPRSEQQGAERPASDHQLLAAVRGLGPGAWSAAKAVAVLHPLGAALPALLPTALDVPADEAAGLLELLRAEGVVHRSRHGASWRFPLPYLASALLESLGPYESRNLSAIAVQAVWEGRATTDDPDYLTDRIAAAGRLVDPDRARAELLVRAREAMRTRPDLAERWWRAGAELTETRPQRAIALLMHAITCFVHSDYERALTASQLVLGSYSDQLPLESQQEIQVMVVSALHNVGDIDGLEEIAAGHRAFQGEEAARVISRAVALSLLDRWKEARELLAATHEVWHGSRVTAALGDLFEVLAQLYAGRPERFERLLASEGHWAGSNELHRANHIGALVTTLLGLGDMRRVEALLAREQFPAERLNMPDRAVLAAMQGRYDEAADLARRCVASGPARGYDAGRATMHQSAAYLLIVRGQLARARETLATARAAHPTLAHLLVNPDAEIDRILGDPEQATTSLETALRDAQDRELLLGAELTWAQLADIAMSRGDVDAARRALTGADSVAATLRTSRARMYAQLVRALVEHDTIAGLRCIDLSRERGQPFERALVISKLVAYGVGDTALLREAYDLYGSLDALLCRAWLRNQMERSGVAVPGRSVTVAENERLLALLVAEGLSNKQLAYVLKTSDKSVEGRLSRLFARTGYRSRIELAAALQNGDYEA